MNMREKIKKQIPDKIFSKISVMESEEDPKIKMEIAQDIIRDLDVEGFEPYIGYDPNSSDIFIALRYRYSCSSVEDAQISCRHDVMLYEGIIHIEDEAYLRECFDDAMCEMDDQQAYDDTMNSIERINNELQDLINVQRPKYVGNINTVEELSEIDGIIQSYSKRLEELEESLENKIPNETKITYSVIAKAVGKTESAIKYWAKTNPTLLELVKLGLIAKMHGLGDEEEKIIAIKTLIKDL